MRSVGYALCVPKPGKQSQSLDALSFEDALAQIEAIIERIEAGEVGLEQSLAEYERGVGLINHCRSKLDTARKQVEDLTRKLQQADDASAGDASEDPDEPGDDDDAEPQDE